jgi:hypothetical protein
MEKRNRLLIMLCVTTSIMITETQAQCLTRKHIDLANKVFALRIKPSDFQEGNVFLTLDTINSNDINAPTDYTIHKSPKPLLKKFLGFMKSRNWDGGFYNYYELFNSPFYDSPLHQSFLVNDESHTYKIDIWNSKSDTSKIEGITVGKYPVKLEKTPY